MSGMQRLANPNEPRVSVLVQAVYRALAPLDYGALVTYADLRKVLFEDPQAPRGRSATLRAARQLLRDDRKLLVNVRGKGYQLANPNEHVSESKRKSAAGQRRYRKALEIVAHCELAKLSPSERQQHDEQLNRASIQFALTKTLARTKQLPSPSEITMPTGKALAQLLVTRA